MGISVASAQTQRGYVKTRGRLQSNGTTIPGTRLSGATVTLKGNNSVTSGANGVFSFAVSNKSFCIINVRKNGYQIYDRDLLGKIHSYSSNDLPIVMDTPDNVLADKLASERKIRRTLQRQLTEKEDEIEALKEQHKITEEQYQKQLQALYKSQENNEKLISEMAEHYSTIDFDQVDEFQRRVAAYIQNGELTRADSLLNTKGSMEERRAQIEKNRSVLNANAEELKKRQEEQEKGEALQTKTIEDFAADCYSRADICKIMHDKDSAAYWLRMRADVDTLNIKWQLEAGLFLRKYLSDFTTSLHYYHRALAVAIAQEGENGENVATSYNNIGSVYDSQGDYVKALEMYQQSLKIRLAIFGETHPDVATSYNNIGFVYSSQGDYVQALEMYQQSLKIYLAIFGENHPDVAMSYNNIGVAYFAATQKGIDVSGFKGLIETMAFTATTVGDDTPAAHAGMEGEYVVLEFADWTIESDSSLLDKKEELRGKPKTIVVMKGDAISQYHFENTIGVEFNFKNIGSQEKQRILKAYREWKKNQ